MNGLFFLFLPLRLDGFLIWRYVVCILHFPTNELAFFFLSIKIVFTPIWISLCMALLFVLSKLILAMIYRCSGRLLSNQHQSGTLQEAFLYITMFIPFSIFTVD